MAEWEHDIWLNHVQACGAQADFPPGVEPVNEPCNEPGVAVALDGAFYPHGYAVCKKHAAGHPLLPLKDLIAVVRSEWAQGWGQDG